MSDRETVKASYEERFPLYSRLADNIQVSIKSALDERGVVIHAVQARVKEFESFFEKISRKSYVEPFEQIEDFCGVRVICYYLSDLDRIAELISNEFVVLSSDRKSDHQQSNEFGYRSDHFIVRVKPGWLDMPLFRGLGELKTEIQVRTILMHAWADVEHKLAYKKQEFMPPQFSRQFSQLSALFEIADERFDSLRGEKERKQAEYKEAIERPSSTSASVEFEQVVNADSLAAVVAVVLPDRTRSENSFERLLEELVESSVTVDELISACVSLMPQLETIEPEIMGPSWGVGHWRMEAEDVIRLALFLSVDTYWERFEKKIPDSTRAVIVRHRN